MEEKMQAAIRSITLDSRTYHNTTIAPTLINFFFGKNGVGKSTIAQQILGGTGVTPALSDYDVLVYDKDFISRNIQEDIGMPGVFSISEGNIEKQNEVAEKQILLNELGLQYKEKKTEYDEKAKCPAALRSTLDDSCWKTNASFRSDFPDTMKNKRGSKSVFADELLSIATPKECDVVELKSLYSTAFGSDSTIYPKLKTVNPISDENIIGFELLSKSIISSADTPFADFIRAIGATDWIRQGHEKFGHVAGDKCPYCKQTLPADYEQQISSCFDAQYETDRQVLQAFKNNYESAIDAVIAILQDNTNNAFPRNDFTEYKGRLDTLIAIIELNKKKLTDKIASPASAVILESIDDKLQEINIIITTLNSAIEENNSIISSRQAKQEECKAAVWKHMAFMVKDDILSYNTSLTTTNTELQQLKIVIDKLISDGNALKKEITSLSSQIVNIDSTMNSINKKLTDSGFQGFKVQKKADDPNKYEIIRDDGSRAHGLSEGERNFIAFLYFYHKVLGRESADSTFKDRIVVIDDPVSSMDSSSLFIVSSIVRELISICFNNGSAAKVDAPRFIKQIFILTHNAFFHKEVSYDRLKYYHCVNFYLIKKANNVSTIDLCTKKDPFSKEPAYEHNYTPVHNSYAALWKEYNEVTSSSALMRIVRQILEYYFIQISGYEGQSLSERILKREDVFIRQNADGSDNRDLLHSVNAMLHYIGTDTQGFNDGLNYVEGSEDADKIKETFKCIFIAMEQEQHYQMMVETAL
ncbi:MAG: AAA family ATPase [Lachnospiraceae bacterium]